MVNFSISSLLVTVLATILIVGCDSSTNSSVLGEMEFPEDNSYSDEKAELGKRLFFDKRLSLDNSMSCASCHLPEKAFTDGLAIADGVGGRKAFRNTPTLYNVGFSPTFMFDAHIQSLEEQALVPIHDTNEMASNIKTIIEQLSADDYYVEAARKLFNREIDAWVITRSLATFQRTLISDNSPFDRYYYKGEEGAISAEAKKGWKIFSDQLYCIQCHTPPHFTNFTAQNNGLYNDYTNDQGRFRIHGDSTDIGKFKIPTLRNIHLTGPYMHDGSLKTLSEVIDHYSRGGQEHVNKSPIIQPFRLSNNEKNALVEFLKSLSDNNFEK